jgi:hypothetical protein
VLPGERGILLSDPHAKQRFNLLTVADGMVESEQGSVFDPSGDGDGEDQGIPPCVKPNIPLCTLEGLIGCQGKIVDVEIGSIGTETGRPCSGPPEDPALTPKCPSESSPSASKSREKNLLKGIVPGIEGGRSERRTSGEWMAAQIVLIPLLPVAQNVVSLVDFLEPVLGLGIVLVCVRMISKGQFSVGQFNFALIRVSCDPKDSVVVFSLHRVIKTRFG